MAFEIIVPRLGWTMEEGVFRGWLRKDGEAVGPGDPIFVLETDKATQEVEAVDGGTLRIHPQGPAEGATVKVGRVLGWLLAPGEEPPAAESAIETGAAPSAPERSCGPQAGTGPEGAGDARRGRGDPAAISPRALRAAAELGMDWRSLKGSGRSGRIVERDVRAAAARAPSGAAMTPAAPAASSGDRIVPHTSLRRSIAEAVVRSARSVVPVTLMAEADATDIVAWRDRRRTEGGEEIPGVTAVFIRIAALALKDHPRLNGRWSDGGIVQPAGIHVAFAVEVEDGLLAPVVRDADRKSLAEIDREARALAARARDRRTFAGDLDGATFTVTNLGSCGVDAFTPVVAPGQCAILGIGRIADRPAVRDGRVVPRKIVALSLTFDHRAVDGAPAGRFLARIRDMVESPDISRREP